MHTGPHCSKQQTNLTHASKTHTKYCTNSYYYFVIIILCSSLYFVFQTKLVEIYGNVRVTYYEYIFNETFTKNEHEIPEYENKNNLLSDNSGELLKLKNPNEILSRGQWEENNIDIEIQTKPVKERQSNEDKTVVKKTSKNEDYSTHLEQAAWVEDNLNNDDSPEENQISYERSTQGLSVENGNENSTKYKSTEIENSTKVMIDINSKDVPNGRNHIGFLEKYSIWSTQHRTTQIDHTTESPIILRLSGDIACKLPILQPFDKGIKSAWEAEDEPDPPECQVKYPPVFKSTFNFTVIKLENTSQWRNCCYKSITRAIEPSSDVDQEVIESKDCIPMPNRTTTIPHDKEFIVIYCTIPDSQRKALICPKTTTNNTLVEIDAIAFVPVKHEEAINSTNITKQNLQDRVNIVIFGLDSVSHMNFMRIMPRVYRFLTQNLSAIGMSGYVKVGDNTLPNMLAALTAKTAAETLESCEKDDFFDDCQFLWKEYAAQGYKTAYSEDVPPISIFNYQKNGFMKPPVDFYNRPLAVFSDNNLGTDNRKNAHICYGPRLAIKFLIDYVKKVALTMNSLNQKYFQFTWCTSLTHDFMKLGKQGENVLLEALEWFNSQNYLNNTILILMSDHGMRSGAFRDTKQGKIEDNMPFVYFTFPQWFREKYPRAIKNMIENNYRLTTPFDLHETILEFLHLDKLEDSEIQLREEILQSKNFEGKLPRGISMFLPSPLNRTCAMASIPEHFCSCHETETLKIDDYLTQQAANFAIYTMNSFVSLYPQCSYLTLENISSANHFFIETNVHTNKIKIEEGVQVIFKVSPGAGEFDATVIRLNGTGNWTLSDMSRVNWYGSQSYCVDDAKMKKYCYCTGLLSNAKV